LTDPESNRPNPATAAAAAHSARPGRRLRVLLWFLVVWAAVAYLIAPYLWERYFSHHKVFADVSRVTVTGDGHPGDPVNIAIVGAEAELVRGMTKAGWYPADPITFASSVRIAADSVLRRPDDDAPVSNLYLFGRRQDLAFEQPVGDSPRQRHHVRFWRWDQLHQGRPVWFGAATFDERVGLSYTTGQVTHHIGPDVDAERDRIAAELQKAGLVQGVEWMNGFHSRLEGRNGGGDLWRTDGRLAIVILRVPAAGTSQ
jgi:hypothetical protein